MTTQPASHTAPELFQQAFRRQAEVWGELVLALRSEWERAGSNRWAVEPEISEEEVLEDLMYGRD